MYTNGQGQQSKIDSLKSKLEAPLSTEEKMVLQLQLADALKYINPSLAKQYSVKVKRWARIAQDSLLLLDVAKVEDRIYYFIGDYVSQMQVAKEAVLLSNAMDDYKVKTDILYQLAGVYLNLQEYDLQLQAFKEALAIVAQEKDTTLLVRYSNAVGYAFKMNKNLDSALYYYNTGLALAENAKVSIPPLYVANLLGNSGLIYSEKANYSEALKRFRASKKIRIAEYHQGHTAGSDLDIAELYEKQALLDSAIYYNKAAINRVKNINGREWMERGFENLFRIYQRKENYKEALLYKIRQDSLAGLIMNVESLQKQSYMQAEIDYEKRLIDLNRAKEQLESESRSRLKTVFFGIGALCTTIVIIILFSRKNRKIEHANKQLKLSNEEKDLLLKEVHHRVKNNLQMVSSLLNLQAKTVRSSKVKQILTDGMDRIKSMALVHQRLYERGKYTEVDFNNYITQVIQHLLLSYKTSSQAKLNIKSKEFIDIDRAITLGLLVNEIVTNALKHNKQHDDLVITLNLSKTTDDQYLLSVSDNGIGFNSNEVKKEKTLGLRLIEILSKQLDGDLSIKNTAEQGVAYSLKIPVDIKS